MRRFESNLRFLSTHTICILIDNSWRLVLYFCTPYFSNLPILCSKLPVWLMCVCAYICHRWFCLCCVFFIPLHLLPNKCGIHGCRWPYCLLFYRRSTRVLYTYKMVCVSHCFHFVLNFFLSTLLLWIIPLWKRDKACFNGEKMCQRKKNRKSDRKKFHSAMLSSPSSPSSQCKRNLSL